MDAVDTLHCRPSPVRRHPSAGLVSAVSINRDVISNVITGQRWWMVLGNRVTFKVSTDGRANCSSKIGRKIGRAELSSGHKSIFMGRVFLCSRTWASNSGAALALSVGLCGGRKVILKGVTSDR